VLPVKSTFLKVPDTIGIHILIILKFSEKVGLIIGKGIIYIIVGGIIVFLG
jgi:hypothetical protein